MDWRSSSQASTRIRLKALITLTAVIATVAGARVTLSASTNNGIAGTWLVEVTLRDCTTNAPLGPSFDSLVTFHRGGTLNESPGATAFAVGQRSDGHGTWNPRPGHTYSQKFVALIRFDTPPNLPGTPGFNPSLPVSPGFFAGWQTVAHTVELSGANQLTSAGTNKFFKSNGEVYRSGCSTAIGERFK